MDHVAGLELVSLFVRFGWSSRRKKPAPMNRPCPILGQKRGLFMPKRRDFLVGAAAGVTGTGAIGLFKEERRDLNPSYAQSGEDVIVASLFDYLRIEKPTYLDIGAYLPIFANNTYLFYQQGSRGVLVEPNIDLIRGLRSKRPGDTVLNVGVGLTGEGQSDYYCMSLAQWNTFDKDEAERRVTKTGGQVKIEKVVPMPLVPINRIMAEFGTPDFLSIDIESLDLAVLKTLDFDRFRPKVICTETLIALTLQMETETTKFMESKGYEVRGMTAANTIYIDRPLLQS
jgi:FkbM family methyltransferase